MEELKNRIQMFRQLLTSNKFSVQFMKELIYDIHMMVKPLRDNITQFMHRYEFEDVLNMAELLQIINLAEQYIKNNAI